MCSQDTSPAPVCSFNASALPRIILCDLPLQTLGLRFSILQSPFSESYELYRGVVGKQPLYYSGIAQYSHLGYIQHQNVHSSMHVGPY
jgi:hypothetical protein